jgi:hypothetical protein
VTFEPPRVLSDRLEDLRGQRVGAGGEVGELENRGLRLALCFTEAPGERYGLAGNAEGAQEDVIGAELALQPRRIGNGQRFAEVETLGPRRGERLAPAEDVERIDPGDRLGVVAAVEEQARLEVVGDGHADPAVGKSFGYGRQERDGRAHVGLGYREQGEEQKAHRGSLLRRPA